MGSNGLSIDCSLWLGRRRGFLVGKNPVALLRLAVAGLPERCRHKLVRPDDQASHQDVEVLAEEGELTCGLVRDPGEGIDREYEHGGVVGCQALEVTSERGDVLGFDDSREDEPAHTVV